MYERHSHGTTGACIDELERNVNVLQKGRSFNLTTTIVLKDRVINVESST